VESVRRIAGDPVGTSPISAGRHDARVRNLATAVLDLAFPATCAGCGHEGAALCPRCVPALDVRLDLPPGAAIGMPADIPAPLVQLEWCAPFGGVVRKALHELKYAGEQRLAVPLGEAVARRWGRAGVGGDVIVHVPVHDDRRRRRGYDQAELIASVAARALGMPFAPILRRSRATIAQFDLDRTHRGANVAGAFDLVAGARLGPRPLAGRWVVLVDDVVTTGATLAACAAVLMDAGALAVSAITVSRER
jgi:competence protein ComFC